MNNLQKVTLIRTSIGEETGQISHAGDESGSIENEIQFSPLSSRESIVLAGSSN